MGQQRRFARHRIHVPILVRSIGSSRAHSYRGHSLDLSEGGLGAVLEGELTPGQVVIMEVVLPGDLQPLTAQARVRHRNALRCGFEFLGPNQHMRERIATACQAAI